MYEIHCDICNEKLESGEGRPFAQGSRLALCVKCTGIEAAVDAEIQRRGRTRAMALSDELEAEKAVLRAEMRGEAPSEGGWGASLPAVQVNP